MSLNRAAEVG